MLTHLGAALDRLFPTPRLNALAYGLSFLTALMGLAGLLWVVGRVTGGN